MYHIDVSSYFLSLSPQLSQNIGGGLIGLLRNPMYVFDSVRIIQDLLVQIKHFLSRHPH
mgnify:CR=1 FL=1